MRSNINFLIAAVAITSFIWYGFFRDFAFSEFEQGMAATGVIVFIGFMINQFIWRVNHQIRVLHDQFDEEMQKRVDVEDRVDEIERRLKIKTDWGNQS